MTPPSEGRGFARTGLVLAAACAIAFTGCAEQMGRGSSRAIYTISGTMEVFRQDLALEKSAQLRIDQQLLFRLEKDPAMDGKWEFVELTGNVLLLLSDSPRVASGEWGLLLQARSLGRGEVKLRYVPSAEGEKPREYSLEVSVSR